VSTDRLAELVAMRKAKGLTQAAVAKQIGVTQATVSRLESGVRTPDLATVERYAMAVEDHVYLSTACLHGIHEHCQCKTNLEGEPKVPGTCKWCGAPCVCECHKLA